MINWIWAIPWVVLIIFSAGWYFGGKAGTKKECTRRYQDDAISELYENLNNLEIKIEQLKEEKVNG